MSISIPKNRAWTALSLVVALLVGAAGEARGAEPIATPARMEPGKVYPLRVSASNSGARVEVINATVSPAYGTAQAPPGRTFVIIDMRWQNTFPLTQINNKQLSTQYVVPKLHDHLYVVCGDRALRLADGSGKWPGCLPDEGFQLPRLGSVLRGNAIFDMPADVPAERMELRFYDFAHGHFTTALTEPPRAPEAAKPLAPPVKNTVIEAAAFGLNKQAEFGGQHAPQGMEFVLVDVRARSTMTTDGDAAAFDPKARPGAKIKIGTVADWTESRRYAQAVVDGEYAYLPMPQSAWPDAPRFLPDVFTGGTLAFLIPESRKSLELRCDFPNAKLPDGRVVRPEGLTLALEGKRAAAPNRPALAAARDPVFDVTLVSQRAADQFGFASAPDGKRFVILDVAVRNMGGRQEFFQPKAQLKYVTAAGEQVEYDQTSYAGPHPPAEQMYIPGGERRAFELAYLVASAEARPRVAYAAVTAGASKVLSLPPLATEAVAAGQAATHAPAPAQAPVVPAPAAPSAPAPATAASGSPALPAVEGVKAESLLPRPHGPARGLEGVGLTAEQVNAAIDRGAAGLWAYIKKQDLKSPRNQFGDQRPHVLAALALVHADAHKKIPEFDAALKAYLTRVEPHRLPTYENGLLCMLIEAYGDPSFDGKLREAARWLIEAQGPGGTWNYGARVPDEIFKTPTAKPQGVLQVSGGTPPGQRGQAWTRLTDWKAGIDGDNSNTQYAILGLQAASRAGVPVPADVWNRSLATARKDQADDGGWDYRGHSRTGYGSMTSAGICAVAICRAELGEPNATQDPAIDRGVAWLDKNFKVAGHPKHADEKEWAFYYLYSLERVGRILDTEFLGANEWYPLGAKYLVGAQKPDGLWAGLVGQEKVDPELPSSFSLLFLTRATASLHPQRRAGPGTLKTAAVAPANRFYVILDASGSMLDNMDGRMKFDIARNAVRSLIDSLPPNSDVALRVYGHRKSALQPDADLDTELKIKMGPLNKQKFNATLDSLRSRGKTPMALSIEDALKDLGNTGTEASPVTLLLLTDGGEDTRKPKGDPIGAAAKIAKVPNLTFHIVGFDINQPEWSQQLQEMAGVSGGKYWPAPKAAELERSVRNAVLGIPEGFVVTDADGHEAAHGQFGDTAQLAEGKYRFSTVFAGHTFEQEFYVGAQELTSITFDASQVKPADLAGGASAAPAAPAASPASPAGEPAVNWPKFCTHCGAPLKPGQKFCSKCGAPVEVK